jgi:hypothetical protein
VSGQRLIDARAWSQNFPPKLCCASLTPQNNERPHGGGTLMGCWQQDTDLQADHMTDSRASSCQRFAGVEFSAVDLQSRIVPAVAHRTMTAGRAEDSTKSSCLCAQVERCWG